MTRRHVGMLGLWLIILSPIAGCELGWGKITWDLGEKDKDVDDQFVDTESAPLTESFAFRDTVSEQCFVEGLRKMRVRGFGIVAGLGDRGSSECPRAVRDELLQEMYKREAFQRRGLRQSRITPEMLLDDLDTAVVVVEGEIPAASSVGDHFDLTVQALPGTQTTSLEGGRLYTMDLHIYRTTGGQSAVEGKALATASGQVFMNPFSDIENAATKDDPREGVILGGGEVKENRRVRLVLSQPSYRRSQAIADRINQRFSGSRKVANAVSASYVELDIPRQFRDDAFHFLALVRHLYLPQNPGFAEQRARDLAEEILSESAPHPDIALAWEGIGRTVIPLLQTLYSQSKPHARFYAALAGLRLGDDLALDVMHEVVADSASEYRLTAITELGYARNMTRAASVLRELLNDEDPRIRVEAYEALLSRHDRFIRTENIGPDNFALDRVPSERGNVIYVRRTGEPRIVLFGEGIQCIPPLFYQDRTGMITINAETGATALTLIRKAPFNERVSPPLPTSLDIGSLVRMLGDDPELVDRDEVHGLALDYSTVTRTLQQLCEAQATNAKFMLQSRSVTEMFGPLGGTDRPESDL